MMKIKVDTLDSQALMASVMDAAERAAVSIAEAHKTAHVEAINSGTTPSGGAQKKRGRRNKPPLLDTGRLRDGLRVEKKENGSVVVRPSADRVDVVKKLHDRGYKTIFNESPDVDNQSIVDAEVRKVDVGRHIR